MRPWISSRAAWAQPIHSSRLEEVVATGSSFLRVFWLLDSLGQCSSAEAGLGLIFRADLFHMEPCTDLQFRIPFGFGLMPRFALLAHARDSFLSCFRAFFSFLCRLLSVWTLDCPLEGSHVGSSLWIVEFPAYGLYPAPPALSLSGSRMAPSWPDVPSWISWHAVPYPVGVAFGLGPCPPFCGLEGCLRTHGIQVPNTHIGGSGMRTGFPGPLSQQCGRWPLSFLECLRSLVLTYGVHLGSLLAVFLRTLWFCCAVAAGMLLIRPVRYNPILGHKRQQQVWSSLPMALAVLGSCDSGILRWQSPAPQVKSRRRPCYALPLLRLRAMCLLLHWLGIASLPHCVWSSPPQEWHNAVHEVGEIVSANAAPFEGTEPSLSPEALMTDEQELPPLLEGPSCPQPWTPVTGEEGPEISQCHFRVMCPRHHDEYVYLAMRIPGVSSEEAILEVRECLVSLKLSFARTLVPTIPQMNEGYATLILGGSWHSQYGDLVVVFDFRRLGGPSYAKRCCLVGTYYEVRQEALKHGFREWDAFAFGGCEPLRPATTVRMVHGGVIQYCPTGYRPVWYGSFASKFQAKRHWQESPLPLIISPRATLLLGIGTTALYDHLASGSTTLAQAAGEMVFRDERHVNFTSPAPGSQLEVLWRGHICTEVLAVDNHAPPSSLASDRICIFIDARQIGQRLVCVWLGQPDVSINYLARYADVHRLPVGFHLAIAHANPSHLENHIRVYDGEVVVLGFRGEDESDFGSDPELSDHDAHDADPDTSTTKPESSSSSATSVYEILPNDSPSAGSSRSRSPHRHGRLHGFCDFAGSCMTHGRGALRALLAAVTCSVRRMCMWTCCDTVQDAYHDGLAQLTSASLPSCQVGALEPLSMKASPPPTLSQRLDAPAGGWRSVPGAEASTDNEGEIATLDAFQAHSPVHEDPESSDEEDEDEGYLATFLVLAPDYLPEQVEIRVDQDTSEQDVCDLANDERAHHRYLLFSCLRAVWPQPARHWGVLLAFHPWSEMEHIACFDTRSIDGRLFAMGVPQVATREQLCSLAGGLDPNTIAVFPYGSLDPLGPDELANFVAGGLVVFSRQHFLPRPGVPLAQMLAQPFGWEVDPDLPSGPWGHHYCCVQEGGTDRSHKTESMSRSLHNPVRVPCIWTSLPSCFSSLPRRCQMWR